MLQEDPEQFSPIRGKRFSLWLARRCTMKTLSSGKGTATCRPTRLDQTNLVTPNGNGKFTATWSNRDWSSSSLLMFTAIM
jgi:hypothetical protein